MAFLASFETWRHHVERGRALSTAGLRAYDLGLEIAFGRGGRPCVISWPDENVLIWWFPLELLDKDLRLVVDAKRWCWLKTFEV